MIEAVREQRIKADDQAAQLQAELKGSRRRLDAANKALAEAMERVEKLTAELAAEKARPAPVAPN